MKDRSRVQVEVQRAEAPPIDLDAWLRYYLELVLALEAFEPVAARPRLSVG